jgi:XTP/dITP diphosphohydrolase
MAPARLRPGDTLVIATHNRHKFREMTDLLAPYGLTLRSAGDLGLPEPAETGASFADNARLKAEAAAAACTLPVLGDDSGLAVDALGGAPGIYSARWAGRERDFGRAMRAVEDRLAAAGATTPAQRGAKFVAVVCYAEAGKPSATYRGEVAGTLVWPPRGTGGFGYDPMFVPEGGGSRTFAEMTAAEKHGLSHRARAVAAFAAAKIAP